MWGEGWRPSQWKLRRLGPRTMTYLLVWDAAAVALVARSVAVQRIHTAHVVELVVLAVLAVGYDETSRRIENQRLGVARGTHVSMRSVWSLVGIAALPVSLFAVLAAAIYAHASAVGVRDNARVAPNRAVFNAATMIVSGAAAGWVLGRGTGSLHLVPSASAHLLLIAAAAAVYFAVNTIAVAGAFTSLRGRPEIGDLGSRADNLLELGTLGIGAIAALAAAPWAAVLVTPAMYLLQRSALVDELQTAATQDPKTGLLNAVAWQAGAEQELRRARLANRSMAVLVVDLDHFKAVNDEHGHLVGDLVLTGVATCLTDTLRDRDLVGRFGGEEFVAVLPTLQAYEAAAAAERVRAAVADRVHTVGSDDDVVLAVRITASIGVASAPAHGRTLAELLAEADAAMYEAKRSGRNTVFTCPEPSTRIEWH